MAHIRDTAPVICRGFVIFEARHAKRAPKASAITPMCAPIPHAMFGIMQGKPGMIFTIEFFRIRLNDDAHATLDRLLVIVA
jgi:hypothetical protein